VGLPAGGTQRRVPGLRREEVAVLAGVSTDWYTRLEKGHIRGVSDDVLSAVARALLLDDAETAHLFHLARAAKPARTARRRTPARLPDSLQQLLDAMTGSAAFIRNGRLDIIATNALGRALYAPVLDEAYWLPPRTSRDAELIAPTALQGKGWVRFDVPPHRPTSSGQIMVGTRGEPQRRRPGDWLSGRRHLCL
jgi:hypothetical protein